ncbi:MAG: N-6 DNA methylase [Ekhidna sp.]|nr:N-6 DNA methylase [Ekhidna sp.]
MIQEQRIYQAYYTKSEPILNYMIDLLALKGNEYILEPCAGDGVFIDPIISTNSKVKIDAFELNTETFRNLLVKYASNASVNVKQIDTLLDIDLTFQCSMGGKYDAVIANPPYGAWRTTEERKQLKKRYNGFYAKESYSLFLYRCIEALKIGGKLVFIIPDTYLNLHRYTDIRKYILTHTKIKEIALFPSSYFPDVNFGYANLSIIALEKSQSVKKAMNNSFQMIKRFKNVEELGKNANHLSYITLNQKKLLSTNDFAFLSNHNPKISYCIEQSPLVICAIA